MIAGDHLYPDAGILAASHGIHGLPSGRIGEPEHPQQWQPGRNVIEAQLAMLRGGRLECQREHPLPSGTDVVDPLLPEAGFEQLIAAGATLPFTHLEDSFGRTFGVDESTAGAVVMQRGHEPILGLERDDVGARIGLALAVPIESGLDATTTSAPSVG